MPGAIDMSHVGHAMDTRDLLGLKIADTEAEPAAFRMTGSLWIRPRPSTGTDNLPEHPFAQGMSRKRDAQVIAALFRRRDGRIVQRHSDKHHIPKIRAPVRQPRDECVIGVDDSSVAVRLEDAN